MAGIDHGRQLAPGQRRGDGSAAARTRRIGRHSGRPASVAQVVDVDPTPRARFEIVAVYLPGVSFAIASARPCANVFTASQSALGVSGTTTWRPLPPVVFTKLSRRMARSRSRTSFAPSIRAVHA